MIHLFKRIYLDKIENVTDVYKNIILSDVSTNAKTINESSSLDELVDECFFGCVSTFFYYLLEKEDKLVIYCSLEDRNKILISLLRSILRNLSDDVLLKILNSYIEYDYLVDLIDTHDVLPEKYEVITNFPDSGRFYDADISNLLYLEDLGFEFLLLSYITNYEVPKPIFLRRLKEITFRNWLIDLKHYKHDILTTGINVNRAMDDDEAIEIGDIYNRLNNSELNWILDQSTCFSLSDFLDKYGSDAIVSVVDKVTTLSKDINDSNMTNAKDIFGISHLLKKMMTNDFASLIEHDIDRCFSVYYSKDAYFGKINFVLASWFYRVAKTKKFSELKGLRLNENIRSNWK